jgi:hypothetical protein
VFKTGVQVTHREAQKQLFAFGCTFVVRHRRQGDGILRNIVMVDETSVSHITLESKQQSLHRNLNGLPKGEFQVDFSKWKIICTVFWDRQGVLLVVVLPQGTTITSAVYCETLKKLRRAIQNKI